MPPKKVTRSSPKKAHSMSEDSDVEMRDYEEDYSEEEYTPPPKRKGRVPLRRRDDPEDEDEAEESAPPPKRKARAPPRRREEPEEEEEPAPPPKRKGRAPLGRKRAASEDDEEPEEDEPEEEAEEEEDPEEDDAYDRMPPPKKNAPKKPVAKPAAKRASPLKKGKVPAPKKPRYYSQSDRKVQHEVISEDDGIIINMATKTDWIYRTYDLGFNRQMKISKLLVPKESGDYTYDALQIINKAKEEAKEDFSINTKAEMVFALRDAAVHYCNLIEKARKEQARKPREVLDTDMDA